MNLTSLVVPIQCDSDVPSSFPFCSYIIIIFECLLEIEGMLFANVFDSEIVYDQHKLKCAPVVLPWAGENCFVDNLAYSIVFPGANLLEARFEVVRISHDLREYRWNHLVTPLF